jgi:hypothetical protein
MLTMMDVEKGPQLIEVRTKTMAVRTGWSRGVGEVKLFTVRGGGALTSLERQGGQPGSNG